MRNTENYFNLIQVDFFRVTNKYRQFSEEHIDNCLELQKNVNQVSKLCLLYMGRACFP